MQPGTSAHAAKNELSPEEEADPEKPLTRPPGARKIAVDLPENEEGRFLQTKGSARNKLDILGFKCAVDSVAPIEPNRRCSGLQ